MIHAISTIEFAKYLGVQPSTIRRAHCLQGHYCGIKPIKLPNRILLWSADEITRLLSGENRLPLVVSDISVTQKVNL